MQTIVNMLLMTKLRQSTVIQNLEPALCLSIIFFQQWRDLEFNGPT